MSSNVRNASYGLDNTGFIIYSGLNDYNVSTKINANPFIEFTDNFTIYDYKTYQMVSLVKTTIPTYDCNVSDSSIVVDPLIQYENQFFCYKVGT